MTLIHKGQFRERANRYQRYHQSENHQTKLQSHDYTPNIDIEQNVNQMEKSTEQCEKTADDE